MNKSSDSKIKYWDDMYATRQWGRYPAEELVRFISRKFKSLEQKMNACILEVGCGPGPNIWYLVREGFAVAGIDGSHTAINQAKKKLEHENLPQTLPQVDLRVGDFIVLPWGDDSFDAVVDIEAIYANPLIDIQKAINEILRVLKPGAPFFGKMFGVNSTGSRTGVMIEEGTYAHPTIGPCAGNDIAHYFSKPELESLFSSFSEVKTDFIIRSENSGEMEIFEWLVTAVK
jgi:ubiquinone/menaquinone biosynthesis C-methylase UbiE